MAFIVDTQKEESTILTPKMANSALVIKSLEGDVIVIIEPMTPWDAENLNSQLVLIAAVAPNGHDAFINDKWIGSSEV